MHHPTPPAGPDDATEALAAFWDREPDTAPQLPTATAGRGLDQLIAERVFGRTVLHGAGGLWMLGDPGDYCPPYSTDLAAAWSIVEHLRQAGWAVYVDDRRTTGEDLFEVTFRTPDDGGRDGWAAAQTVPLAICRAALDCLERDGGD